MPTLEREGRPRGPLVVGFSGRGFRVDDTFRDGGLILTPVAALPWEAESLDGLDPASIGAALDLSPPPEFVLIGTGARLRRPQPSFVRALDARGIGVEPMDSRAAARAWGVLRGEDRWIAAALLPTDA